MFAKEKFLTKFVWDNITIPSIINNPTLINEIKIKLSAVFSVIGSSSIYFAITGSTTKKFNRTLTR